VSSDAQVAEAMIVSGTDTGGFLQHPPTGKPFRFFMMTVYILKDRQIVYARRAYDLTGFLLQLATDSAIPTNASQLYGELSFYAWRIREGRSPQPRTPAEGNADLGSGSVRKSGPERLQSVNGVSRFHHNGCRTANGCHPLVKALIGAGHGKEIGADRQASPVSS
jgi:SnoaL-like polyketide cyclase